jgi:hypothetical protein
MMMMPWWCHDDAMMMTWWWHDDDMMMPWWSHNDDMSNMMMTWWWHDGDLMMTWWWHDNDIGHDRSHSWIGTGTSRQSDGDKLIILAQKVLTEVYCYYEVLPRFIQNVIWSMFSYAKKTNNKRLHYITLL